MPTPEALDAIVYNTIDSGRNRFKDIVTTSWLALGADDQIISQAFHRQVDSALQRLRKRGAIEYTGASGWRLSDGESS